MAQQDRIRSLRQKHATLDQAILKEAARLMPDDGRLKEMKLQKLLIKDTLADIARQHSA